MRPQDLASQKPFFIVGCPRSGTTLLQAMLNRHDDVVVPPETKIFYYFHGVPTWIRRRTVRRISSDLGIHLPLDFASRSADTVQLWRAVQSRFLAGVSRSDAKWFGDKTPEHSGRLFAIHECFPESPIIVLIRDGRDVAASLTRVPWIKCNLRAAAMVWRYYMQQITQAVDLRLNHIYTIRFERLIAEPAEVLQELFKYLDLEDRSVAPCLTPNPTRDSQIFPKRESDWKIKATQELDPTRAGRAMTFPRSDLRAVESACGDMLERWGYPLCYQRTGTPVMAGGISSDSRLLNSVLNYASAAGTIARLPPMTIASELSRFLGASVPRPAPMPAKA